MGWDREKPRLDRRPYRYVYFLNSPLSTRITDKSYFQKAFDLNSNPQWLVGQRYFNDEELLAALERKKSASIEGFLGIAARHANTEHPKSLARNIRPDFLIRRTSAVTAANHFFEPPDWLKPLVGKVTALKNDPEALERDHEDLVASLFELLGYERTHDIKFRRGNIDIRIDKENHPLITIEVKADWALSPDSKKALTQAYNYSHETKTPFVVLTNGDRYCIYDRRQGLSYKENLCADLSITRIDQDGVTKLNSLRKENIK